MRKSSRSQDAWTEAWSERYAEPAPEGPKRSRRSRSGLGRGLYLIASAALLAVVAAPLAIAASDGGAKAAQGGAVTGSSGVISGSNNSYTLYARNRNSGDGGAQADTCTSNVGNEACFNMVNFGTGYAGSFRTRGNTGFLIQTSGAGQATPFQLSPNATGMVQYLNADTVDGMEASQLQGISGLQQVSSQGPTTSQDSGGTNAETFNVSCPSGKQLLSATASIGQTAQQNNGIAVLQGVKPTSSTAAQAIVVVSGTPNATATYQATVYATCATVPSS